MQNFRQIATNSKTKYVSTEYECTCVVCQKASETEILNFYSFFNESKNQQTI